MFCLKRRDNMIIIGLLLLAVFVTAYFGAYLAIKGNVPTPILPAPNINSWGNSQYNNSDLVISIPLIKGRMTKFNITANQTIDTWNWFKDGVNQSNNYDNFSTNFSNWGTYTIQVNATNTNGTSNTITWTVKSVDANPIYVWKNLAGT